MAVDSPLARCVSDLEAEEALALVKTRITQGDMPEVILAECREGLEDVGLRFESGEYFIADLMYAASTFKKVMDLLGPELREKVKGQKRGTVIIGTVKNDIHEIGKNLVASMLDASGFDVHDMGVNVSPETICQSIAERKPDIVALSCLLNATVDSMEEAIAEIRRAGLRERVKIIVGGIPVSPQLASAMGADAYGDNAHEAVLKCRQLLGGRADA